MQIYSGNRDDSGCLLPILPDFTEALRHSPAKNKDASSVKPRDLRQIDSVYGWALANDFDQTPQFHLALALMH